MSEVTQPHPYLSPPKRKRQSGLTGVELAIALEALKNLAAKARFELNTKAEGDRSTVLSHIEKLTALLQARADGPQIYSFSGMTGDLLDDLQVRFSGILKLKDDAASTAALSDTLGNDQLWSATTLLTHLRFLENLVPRCNESATRLWINAFFYRVSTMIPNHLKMALSVEQVVPAVTVSDNSPHTVSGFIDFTAAVMDPAKLTIFLERPVLRPDDTMLFVSEAKDVTKDLQKHVPQAVSEMLACARRAKKKIVRGVVTDGREWIYLILTLRDGDGTATYVRSDKINIGGGGGFTADHPSQAGVSLISAILAHWILHSHQPLDETTDFFKS
ncbi:hypothetical protein CPB84DRAFT_1837410 [Gymnopilus junonius]|uniref:Uncharacterized protein n=1 Tax=Gymnopilus junonius TaxID=109634 RepID=A0A9P5NKR4_GYMJU|nr:hypothetical protein CPB84DRAFT_1837410 [Gymnopilus junonius]